MWPSAGGDDYTSQPGWMDDALLVNSIAMGWWRQTHPATTLTQPAFSVSTPFGAGAVEINPILLVLGVGLVIYLILK
jgi:hypothetical protein